MEQKEANAMIQADRKFFEGEIILRKYITELIKDPYEMQMALERVKLCVKDLVLAVGRGNRP